MTAPTADAATLITAWRDAAEFVRLAIHEHDNEARKAGMEDRRTAAHRLTSMGLGWVVVLLKREHEALARVTDDQWARLNTPAVRAEHRAELAKAEAAVNDVLARCN